jgi:hypothetical protein
MRSSGPDQCEDGLHPLRESSGRCCVRCFGVKRGLRDGRERLASPAFTAQSRRVRPLTSAEAVDQGPHLPGGATSRHAIHHERLNQPRSRDLPSRDQELTKITKIVSRVRHPNQASAASWESASRAEPTRRRQVFIGSAAERHEALSGVTPVVSTM